MNFLGLFFCNYKLALLPIKINKGRILAHAFITMILNRHSIQIIALNE